MAVQAGVALIAGGAVLSSAALLRWRRLASPVAIGLLVLAGSAIGAGALLVQDQAGFGSWVITLCVLGGSSALHGWLVFGRPGRVRRA